MSADYLAAPFGSLMERTADHVLREAGDVPQIVLGPVVWEPAPAGRRWYFAVATCGSDGFRADHLAADTSELADAMRAALWMALIRRGPIVLHDTDDELQMAQLCAALWPCRETAAIAADIKAERCGTRH